MREKLLSLALRPFPAAPKVTVDVHDFGRVQVTESGSARCDVAVLPKLCGGQLLAPIRLPLDGPPGLLLPDGTVHFSRLRDRARHDETGALATGLFANNWLDGLSNVAPVLNVLTTHLKCALFTASVAGGTVNYDAAATVQYGASPFNANEASGTNYTAGGSGDGSAPPGGGTSFGSPTWANLNSSGGSSGNLGFLTMSAASPTWQGCSVTAAGALVYDNAGAGSTKPGLIFVNFGGSYTTNLGTFAIQWAATGIWYWQLHG